MSDFYAKRLTVWISGVGNVSISGRVDEQDITLTGNGGYQAGNLTSTKAAIRINGIGNADLQVRDVLHAEMRGIGAIRYRGNLRQVDKSVTGMGTIISRSSKILRRTAMCSDLITSAALLDYIAAFDWDSVRIASPSC